MDDDHQKAKLSTTHNDNNITTSIDRNRNIKQSKGTEETENDNRGSSTQSLIIMMDDDSDDTNDQDDEDTKVAWVDQQTGMMDRKRPAVSHKQHEDQQENENKNKKGGNDHSQVSKRPKINVMSVAAMKQELDDYGIMTDGVDDEADLREALQTARGEDEEDDEYEETSNFSQISQIVPATTRYCMLDPSPSPIKIFATRQDEELRKRHSKDHWSYVHCWTLRELIGVDGLDETIEWLVLSNFIVDFEFLLQEIPELVSIPQQALIIFGSKDSSELPWKQGATKPNGDCTVDFLHRDPSQPIKSPSNPLSAQFPWGCHHTKLFLVGFSSGRLRVVIHTSNLRWNDVHLKTQGAFVQDFLPKQQNPKSTTTTTTVPCDFQETLLAYIQTYHYTKKQLWSTHTNSRMSCTLTEHLAKYDFSTAKAILIPSTPGYHKPYAAKHKVGYLQLRMAIATYTAPPPPPPPIDHGIHWPQPIICQFSSIGSLSSKYLHTLEVAWDTTWVHHKTRTLSSSSSSSSSSSRQSSHKSSSHNLKLVYPTIQEIVQSVEGRLGGGSVPGRTKNVQKDFLRRCYHKWSTSSSSSSSSTSINTKQEHPFNKGFNVPHIKTYYQLGTDRESMDWFVLTSHNLSKGV